ncbi:MAG: PPK2 family polyphosphate kinase [Gammaproteobacteria bacterium]
MIDHYINDLLVPFDGSYKISDSTTLNDTDEKESEKSLKKSIKKISKLQRKLLAQDKHSLLLVFQAMDAAGKDSTIRAVMTGIDPSGCQVFSFKKPSKLELDHDFLWRSATKLPERGRIGIFNRSYYEEVLVVKVHPELLKYQRLPKITENIWQERYESIRDHEKHLSRNGTVIVKFWLNVSQEEQHRRFLSRIETQEKNWKFSHADLDESKHWPEYMNAYQDLLNETSRPWAPWYAIPADNKKSMRAEVAQILLRTLENMPLAYPTLTPEDQAGLDEARKQLII